MEFRDERGVIDTATTDVGRLMGLLKFLTMFRGQKTFVEMNGPDAVALFVRSLRARMFRERGVDRANGKHVSWMNTLDPPNCRCGRKGTRIIGTHTFCQKCGPTEQDKEHRRWRDRLLEAEGADIATKRESFDKVDMQRRGFKNTKKKH